MVRQGWRVPVVVRPLALYEAPSSPCDHLFVSAFARDAERQPACTRRVSSSGLTMSCNEQSRNLEMGQFENHVFVILIVLVQVGIQVGSMASCHLIPGRCLCRQAWRPFYRAFATEVAPAASPVTKSKGGRHLDEKRAQCESPPSRQLL